MEPLRKARRGSESVHLPEVLDAAFLAWLSFSVVAADLSTIIKLLNVPVFLRLLIARVPKAD